jgi:nucleoside-diphosphate-sugar epimerase
MRVLIVGCGYVGMEVARACLADGHEVHGVRRSPAGLAMLAAAGIQPLAGDVADASSVATWPRRWDVVVNAVSSSGGGLEGYRRAYLEGSTNLASHLRDSPTCRVVHVGSTSVYPQTDGSWVDEESPAEPVGEAGRVLVATEQAWLDAWRRHALPVLLLRASGIYGPGRGRMLAQVLSGEARIEGDGSRWLNMIHRDDVAGAVLSAMARGVPGRIYNVTDNEPVQQRDLLAWLASSRGLPVPPRQDATARPVHGASPSMRARTNKRVSNRRLRDELGWRPRFPTFREGYPPGTPAP